MFLLQLKIPLDNSLLHFVSTFQLPKKQHHRGFTVGLNRTPTGLRSSLGHNIEGVSSSVISSVLLSVVPGSAIQTFRPITECWNGGSEIFLRKILKQFSFDRPLIPEHQSNNIVKYIIQQRTCSNVFYDLPDKHRSVLKL